MYFLDRGQKKVEVLRQRRQLVEQNDRGDGKGSSRADEPGTGKTSSAASSAREVGRARLGLLVDGGDGRG